MLTSWHFEEWDMFWKKAKSAKKTDTPDVQRPPVEDTVKTASKDLAASLKRYEYEFRRAAADCPDPELEAAKRKVAIAETLLHDSGLKKHIARVLHTVKHWPSWAKRDDFQQYNYLAATDISGETEVQEGDYRRSSVHTIRLSFKGKSWVFILEDKGRAYGSGGSFGNLELQYEGRRVFKSLMSKGDGEGSIWECNAVNALQVGDWMKDIAEMSDLAENCYRKRMNSYHEQEILEAAKQIDL
jgi:hypothetical protein